MNDLEELDRLFGKVIEEFPKAKKELLNTVGDMLESKVSENINTHTKVHKGELTGSVRKVVTDNYVAIRPDRKKAPHTHLVENGHRNIISRGVNKGKMVSGDKSNTFVTGKHMYRNAFTSSIDEIEALSQELKKDFVERFNRG